MYLIDTNIFLELLLEQKKADEVARFLKEIPLTTINLSEFAFNSMGLFFLNRKRAELFLKFVDDVLLNGEIKILKLEAGDMKLLIQNAQKFQLDFDDAYQYTVAQKHDLTLVSFDKDFDKTKLKRKTPAEILATEK